RAAAKKARANQKAALKAAAMTVPVAAAELPAEQPLFTPEAFAQAVKAAVAPLAKRQARQDKVMRRQRKLIDAMADQPDTPSAPYRGAGSASINKASAAPAVPQTAAEAAALAQTANIQRLHHDWRNSSNPEVREAAYREMTAQLGITPMTDNPTPFTPFRT